MDRPVFSGAVMQDGLWRIGAPEDGLGVMIPAEWITGLDWAVALALLVAAIIVTGGWRKAQRTHDAGRRLAGLDRACGLLDRVLALSYELEERYGRRDGAGEADLPAVFGVRREMATAMADARAALEAYGDLAEVRLAEDAALIAMRPVVEHPPALGEGARSLERLRAMVTRLRFEAGEVRDVARKRLGYRAHGTRKP